MFTEMKQADPKNDGKFKSFNDTFPYCAFALAISMIYPKRDNVRVRYLIITTVILANGLTIYWFLMYLWKCIYNNDIFNVSRNLTVGILILLFIFKSFYATSKTDKFAHLLEKISHDLLKGNNMDDDYQKIYERYINLAKLGQKCWIYIPIIMTSQFPIYAAATTIYESLKTDVGKKYMVHDMDLKYIEDKQYESPIYEVFFAIQCFLCVTLCPNFSGFDGSFCIATTHLRLKLKLLGLKVKKAFKDSKNRSELITNIKESVKDHQEALTFYNDLQDLYGCWLFSVFLITSVIISLNVLQIYLSKRIDPKYTIFAISGVIHIFTPCYYASNLMKTSEELSWDLYCSEWEAWGDPTATKLLIFMIATSQRTLILTGMGLVYFNMKLFINIMQTTYSLFTLISS